MNAASLIEAPSATTRSPRATAAPATRRLKPRLVLLAAAALLFTVAAGAEVHAEALAEARADPQPETRADTASGQAAIVAAHPQAVAAGRAIIDAGGNAFDATIAITAALGVVEPYGSGLGGGGFYLLQPADGDAIFLDARETAPSGAHRDLYRLPDEDGTPRVDRERIINHPLGAGIPGIPAALQVLETRASLPRVELLEPAIRLARDGFDTNQRFAQMAQFRVEALQNGGDVFLVDGAAPPAGHRLVQADLADTLQTLASEGFESFYQGPLAETLIASVREHGGLWTREDLAGYRAIERPPLTFRWRNTRVITAPPPSSGGIAMAQTLGILARLEAETPVETEIEAEGTATDTDHGDALHALVEALRLAYRDRALYLGDADFLEHDPRERTTDATLDRLAADVPRQRARPSAELLDEIEAAGTRYESPQTTHFAVVDPHGNRVAATITLNLPFGSGFVAPGTGVLLNNEMDDFAAAPGTANAYGLIGFEANAIAPGKRPLSSMSPTIIEDPRAVHLLGSPGGSRIITTVLQAILAADAGLSAEQIAARPRIHHQFLPDAIEFEPGAIDARSRRELVARGHRLQPKFRPWGDLGVIRIDRGDGRVTAAADPRAPSVADVWQPPSR